MLRNTSSLITVILLLLSCSTKSLESRVQTIFLESEISNPAGIKVSDIGTKIKYVPLESTDSTMLIGNNPKATIYQDKIIVASENTTIKVFDAATGKFLHTIGDLSRSGKGSDDLITFVLNPYNGELLVSAFEIFSYRVWDVDGNFLRTMRIPNLRDKISIYAGASDLTNFVSRDRVVINSGSYLNFFNTGDTIVKSIQIGDTSAECLSKNFDWMQLIPNYPGTNGTIKSEFVYRYKISPQRKTVVFPEERVFHRYDDKLFLKEIYSPKCYRIENDTLIETFIFDAGRLNPSAEELYTGDNLDKRAKVAQVIENDAYVYFECVYGDGYIGLYDKKNDKVKMACANSVADDINDYIPLKIYTVSDKGNFAAIINPYEIMEWIEENPNKKNLLPKVKENDNVIIAVIE